MIFCLIHDKQKESGLRTYYKHDKALFTEMNKDGWGVYFAVNKFEATQTEMDEVGAKTARNIQFLKKLKYVFADLDIAKAGDGQTREEKDKKKQEVIDALNDKLPPTMIIKTSNGVQPLWEIDEECIDEETQLKYVNTINGVIEWSKVLGAAGDAVKDVTRILRLPGYNHMKEEPFMVTMIKHPDAPVYSLEDITKEFGDYCVEKKEIYIPPVRTNITDPVSLEIDRLDIKDVVLRAFNSIGRSAEFDKQDRLKLDGRLTGTFKSKQGEFMASTSHEPFEGNKITVVADILTCSNKEARKWIMEEFNISYSNIIKPPQINKAPKTTMFPKQNPNHKPFTWGTRGLDKAITSLKKYNHVVLVGETGGGKSTYAFDVAVKNAELGFNVLFFSIEMSTEELYVIKSQDYAGITKEEDRVQNWSDEKQQKAEGRYQYLKGLKTLNMVGVDSDDGLEVESILKYLKEQSPDVAFIDNMDLILDSTTMTELQRQESISRKLTMFSKIEKVPTILLHHYNKPVSKKGGRGLESVRGSSKITHNPGLTIKVKRLDLDDIVEPTAEERALLTVSLMKDRRFGDVSSYARIYWRGGTFVDDFHSEKEMKLAVQINKIFNSQF